MNPLSILDLTPEQCLDLDLLRPAVRRHESELKEKTREYVRIGRAFQGLRERKVHGDTPLAQFLYQHFGWKERHSRRYLSAGLIDEALLKDRCITLERLAALGPAPPEFHAPLLDAAAQQAHPSDLSLAGKSAQLHLRRHGDIIAARAHAVEVALRRALPLWLVPRPKKPAGGEAERGVRASQLEQRIDGLNAEAEKLVGKLLEEEQRRPLLSKGRRLLLTIAALCGVTPAQLLGEQRKQGRGGPHRPSRPDPGKPRNDNHIADVIVFPGCDPPDPTPPAPPAPEAPPPAAPESAAPPAEEAAAAPPAAAAPAPPIPEAPAPAAPEAPAPAAEQAPPDPDAPVIGAMKALDRPTREHLSEQLYLLMTDLPMTPPLMEVEQLPALCQQQGVALPGDDYQRWLKRLSQWDQGKRGMFLLPFYIKAKLPGWRNRLSLLLASRMPEPLRTHAWAAYLKYPTFIPITWEDIQSHYGPAMEGGGPMPEPIPLRRPWPSDEV